MNDCGGTPGQNLFFGDDDEIEGMFLQVALRGEGKVPQVGDVVNPTQITRKLPVMLGEGNDGLLEVTPKETRLFTQNLTA